MESANKVSWQKWLFMRVGFGVRKETTNLGYQVGLTSYVGNLGTAYNKLDGVLYGDSQTRLGNIYDGTINTARVR